MEYTKRRRYTVNTEVCDLKDVYLHDLQMYDFPPTGEIPFAEFQQLGLDRLKLLQHVESITVRTDLKSPDDRKTNLNTALTKDGLKYFIHLLHASGSKSCSESDLQTRRKDHISHFVTRLSYCQDPDRQMWFINQETELFKLRFSSLDKDGIEKLLSMHNISCTQVTQEEIEEIREQLYSSTRKTLNIDMIEFYKVPFQKVTDLIRSRRVYVAEGIAYIPQGDLVSLFASHFKKNLINGMEYAKNYVYNISDDERLVSFLKLLPGSFSGMTRIVWTSTTTPIDKLDELSKTSYPLCMRILHEALRTHHHLKNSGRIQYGLFIKGIGVTMEDALRFWKMEFTKKLDPDKFDKQYAYTIRHTFGREGKQTNYTPLGCPKIISTAVGAGEYHGCPYRHMDRDSLQQKLTSYGLSPTNASEITGLAKEGHFHLACTKYFELAHNRLPEKPIIHPNGYFVESRAILAKDISTESEGNENFSQGGRINERVIATPVRRIDRTSGSAAANIDRLNSTPLRSIDKNGTPSKITERSSNTPVRGTTNTPKRIDMHLNDDEIAELMDDGL